MCAAELRRRALCGCYSPGGVEAVARAFAQKSLRRPSRVLDASPPLKQRLSSGGALLDMPSFVSAVLYGPLNLQALPGSGAAQAPQVARLLCTAGLRAIDQSGPPGVAIFTDSHTTEALAAMAPEVALVWLMSGLAAEQAECEAHYAAELRRPLLVACLLDRLAQVRGRATAHAPTRSARPSMLSRSCSPPCHAALRSVQPIVLCTACNHFFLEDDWELAVMQKKACPFCKVTVNTDYSNGCAAAHPPPPAAG